MDNQQLPVFVLAFDQSDCCEAAIKAIALYLDMAFLVNQNEKRKIKAFLRQILESFLCWPFLGPDSQEPVPEQGAAAECRDRVHVHGPLALALYPARQPSHRVLYTSTKMYVFVRMLYLLFERFCKAK